MPQGFRNLDVWEKSMNFAQEAYDFINTLPTYEKFALADQMRRCVVSIPSNIAEGQGRNSNKDFIKFLYIAKGSLCEIQTQFELCVKFSYCNTQRIQPLVAGACAIDKMLNGLIKALILQEKQQKTFLTVTRKNISKSADGKRLTTSN